MTIAILRALHKTNSCMKYFDNPEAKRTASMLDRLMRLMKKHKINSQTFHSDIEVTTKKRGL